MILIEVVPAELFLTISVATPVSKAAELFLTISVATPVSKAN